MASEWRDDLRKSTDVWQHLVWPAVRGVLRGGELLRMEDSPEHIAYLLDVRAGIDGFQVHETLGLRGIASRVQVTARPYNTFTIRTERESGVDTEYTKRREAINTGTGWLYPALTIHAYVKTWSGPLLSVGVAFTGDIIKCVERRWCTFNQVQSRGVAKFAVVDWQEMRRRGFAVAIVTP